MLYESIIDLILCDAMRLYSMFSCLMLHKYTTFTICHFIEQYWLCSLLDDDTKDSPRDMMTMIHLLSRPDIMQWVAPNNLLYDHTFVFVSYFCTPIRSVFLTSINWDKVEVPRDKMMIHSLPREWGMQWDSP